MGRVGYQHTPAAKAAISAWFKGIEKTDAARAKMRAAKIGRPLSPEHRAKLSEARRRNAAIALGLTDDEWLSAWEAGTLSRPLRHAYPKTLSRRAKCVYCGGRAVSWDHVIPRGLPGWDSDDNLVPACQPCNSSKGHRSPEEWFAALAEG